MQSSDGNDSHFTKDLFNFTSSDVKQMSPIAKEDESLPISSSQSTPAGPQNQENDVEESKEQLTPQEIEEYNLLKRKQAEIDQRLKEIDRK